MNSGLARCSISALAASAFGLVDEMARSWTLIGEITPFGPPGSGEKALASNSSGSSFLAAMPTEPVLAMKPAVPERYAWLSPAPSQVVLPGENRPLSQAFLSQVSHRRVSGESIVTFLPAS